jgi:hypothetical protein
MHPQRNAHVSDSRYFSRRRSPKQRPQTFLPALVMPVVLDEKPTFNIAIILGVSCATASGEPDQQY